MMIIQNLIHRCKIFWLSMIRWFQTLKQRLAHCVMNYLMADKDPVRTTAFCDFSTILYEIRPGDVLLFEGRSRVSRVVRLITQSSWSHAALYIGHLYNIQDRELRQRIALHYQGDPEAQLLIESVMGLGVVIRPISQYHEDNIRICRPRGLSKKDADLVINYAIHRLGIGYNVRQIFDLARFLFPWTILPRKWRSSIFMYAPGASTKLTCSLLLAEAFAAARFPIFPNISEDQILGVEIQERNPMLCTPSDFDLSPFFEIIKYPMLDGMQRSYRFSRFRMPEYHDDEKSGHEGSE